MTDPLAEVVALLAPQARFSKVVSGAGAWRVRRADIGCPFYCILLEGNPQLALDGQAPLTLRSGDFILVPAGCGFTMSSVGPSPGPDDGDTVPVLQSNGEYRSGMQDVPADVVLLVGHCEFGSPDAALLVSLLPQLVHVRAEPRLATLVQLVGDESRAQRPGRDVILGHLLEVLLIEALRSGAGTAASPGLIRGLADERLARAIRRMHQDIKRAWTVAELAQEAALSRSVFFERFTRAVGVAPMEYLLRWRMGLAKNLLRRRQTSVGQVAENVGYGSASAFSVAFTRHAGLPPARFAQQCASARDG